MHGVEERPGIEVQGKAAPPADAAGPPDVLEQLELVEHRLQERQLHLETVLARVGGIQIHHPGQGARRGASRFVHRYSPQGGLEGAAGGQREPLDEGAMRRADQHDPRDTLARGPEPGEDRAALADCRDEAARLWPETGI